MTTTGTGMPPSGSPLQVAYRYAAPAGLDGLNAELSDVACGLTAVLEDRRRTSFPLSTVYIF